MQVFLCHNINIIRAAQKADAFIVTTEHLCNRDEYKSRCRESNNFDACMYTHRVTLSIRAM